MRVSSIPGASDRVAPTDVRLLCGFFGLIYFLQSVGDPSSGIVAQPLRSLLRRWEESPGDIALFMALISVPWAIKPVFGLISDYYPLHGSKRRIYLMLSCAVAAAGFALLSGTGWLAGDFWILLAVLMLPAVGVAFSDVVVDGIMIDEGQPRGLTGLFQSVQWTAAYGGMLLTGVLGGYFSQIGRPDLAFGLCALMWGAALAIAAIFVEERRAPTHAELVPSMKAALAGAGREAGFIALGLFLFVWNVNPLWTTVLYLHLTEVGGVGEEAFGRMISVFSFGCMIASALYPFYCRKLAARTLFLTAVVSGAVANLLYLFAFDVIALYAVALIGGFAYMTGTMIQMDIAATRVPLAAAATLFAVLMALSNLASSVGEAIGGNLYEVLEPVTGTVGAYNLIVLLSTLIPLLCLPLARHIFPRRLDRSGEAPLTTMQQQSESEP